MRQEKIIIFDFDGVIADSFEIAFAVNKLSRPTITRERYRRLFDGNIYDASSEYLAVNEVDFFVEYGERLKTLGIDEKIKVIIKKLRENFSLFIISSTTTKVINDYLARQGILSCFSEVLGSDIATSKVKKFKLLFEKYKISPAEAIFITDTAGDIKEARTAKVNFIIGILGGYQARISLEKAAPDAIAEDFNDFFKIVQTD